MKHLPVFAVFLLFFGQQIYVAAAENAESLEQNRFLNLTNKNTTAKIEEQQRKEREKDISKRRKEGEVIPWIAIGSAEMVYESEVALQLDYRMRNTARPHPERVMLLLNLINQTPYPVVGAQLHVKVVDAKGNVKSDKLANINFALLPWEAKNVQAVYLEANSREDGSQVHELREMLIIKSVKPEIGVNKIEWKNGKITGNLPEPIVPSVNK